MPHVGTSVLGVLFPLAMVLAIWIFAPVWLVLSLVELYRCYASCEHDGLPRARLEDARWWRIRVRPGLARPLTKVLASGFATAFLGMFAYLTYLLHR